MQKKLGLQIMIEWHYICEQYTKLLQSKRQNCENWKGVGGKCIYNKNPKMCDITTFDIYNSI